MLLLLLLAPGETTLITRAYSYARRLSGTACRVSVPRKDSELLQCSSTDSAGYYERCFTQVLPLCAQIETFRAHVPRKKLLPAYLQRPTSAVQV